MGQQTGINWCDATFNPWWGCERVSPGCQHCYAENTARRWGTKWGKNAERRFFGDKHWAEPVRWNRLAERDGIRLKVFCASMADVFEDRDDLVPHRERLFELIGNTPHLDWLLLTKRPQNVVRLATWGDPTDRWLPNIWIGTTVEDQQRADERIPELLKIPASIRFLSCEPLLGPVDLKAHWLRPTFPSRHVDWVIAGGESGQRARRMDPDGAHRIVQQCGRLGIPVWFKQAGKVLGREWSCPDSHGEDWTSWPEWARVRKHPISPAVST